MSGNFQYQHMSKDQMSRETNRVCNWASEFVTTNGYDESVIELSQTAIYQIITRVDQRKQYFKYFHGLNISDLKELALYAFWITKLHPLQITEKGLSDDQMLAFESINSKFSVFLIIKKFRALAEDYPEREQMINKFFTSKYLYELIYSFTYRDISKEAMILLVETIAIGLGFDPYNPKGKE